LADTRELALKAADKVKVEYKKATLAPVHTIEEVLHHAGNRIHATENKSMRVVPFARLVSAKNILGEICQLDPIWR